MEAAAAMIDVDLFCGAGNATLGLKAAGADPIGFEWNPDACATHHAAGHRTVRTDLSVHPWRHLRGRVRLMHGSPPCQPFSSAGDGAGEDDPRDGMPWMLRAVDEARPDLVTIENVPGLTFRKHRRYFGAFVTSLAGLGYAVEYRILNAADYGVPQCRDRLIIVARADGLGYVRWPRPTHAEHGRGGRRPWVTMADALGWEPDDLVGFPRRADTVSNKAVGGVVTLGDVDYRARDLFPSSAPSPVVTEKGRSWSRWRPQPGSWADGRGGNRRTYGLNEPAPAVVLGRDSAAWCWVRPAATVAGDTRVHPPGHKVNADDLAHGRTGHDRAGTNAVRVTLPELAALQAFPAGYPFVGNRTSIARQIGNALPAPLIAAVARVNLEAAA